eukprot:7381255-Prymnesium_polylepis.1
MKRNKSQRRTAADGEADAPKSLVQPDVETMLLRDNTLPYGLWTMGERTHGQTGHASERPENEAFPVSLELSVFRGGVRSVHAGPFFTAAVGTAGDAIAFGAGPFRLAGGAQATPEADESLSYAGAPPFRVRSAGATADAHASGAAAHCAGAGAAAATAGAAAASSAGTSGRGGRGGGILGGQGAEGRGRGLGRREEQAVAVDQELLEALVMYARQDDPRYERTEDHVKAAIERKRSQSARPVRLEKLLMPVQQLEGGDDFCICLMQNGLLFAWGDGDEGKLGLGRPVSQEKPTMIDMLLPSEFADAASKSENKDALKKAGAKIIRPKGREFCIGLISCGARHTIALSHAGEAF